MGASIKLRSPEDVTKALLAENSADGTIQGLFNSGGDLNPEQQLALLKDIRAYSVMLAPAMGLDQFPEDAPVRGGQFLGGGNVLQTFAPGNVRMVPHSSGALSGTYDTAYVGDTITRGAARVGATEYMVQEASQDRFPTATPTGNYGNSVVKFGRRSYEMKKLRSSSARSTEFLTQSILGNRLNTELSNWLAPRLAHDFEDLAINGDTNTPLAEFNPMRHPRANLLDVNDGWVKLSLAEAPTEDANGANVDFDHFMRAIRRLPPSVAQTNFRWWMNPRVLLDWRLNLHTAGLTSDAMRDRAMLGDIPSPLGLPITQVPLMPIDLAIANAAAVPPRWISGKAGPYVFHPPSGSPTDTSVSFTIRVDGVGADLTVTLDTYNATTVQNRLYTIERLVKAINDAAVANVNYGAAYAALASVGQHGHLVLTGIVTGGASDIKVMDAEADNDLVADVLGFEPPPGGVLGDGAGNTQLATGAAAAAGSIYNGSLIWLAQPQNFVWHVSTAAEGTGANGLRAYMKFEQETDEWLFDIYSYQDFTIERPDRMVVIKDIAAIQVGEANPY